MSGPTNKVSRDVDGATDAPAVEFRHVSLSFGDQTALSDVSFELRRGRMICVTGAAACAEAYVRVAASARRRAA